MNGVHVKNAGEALYIASEMEKRAVKLYERAAMLWPENAMAAAITGMLSDERGRRRADARSTCSRHSL